MFDNRWVDYLTVRKNAKYVPTMNEERKKQLIKRVLFKLRIIRIFDNRKTAEKYIPVKGAKYVPTLTEDRKKQITKRAMLKIKCILAFTNGYKWNKSRADA